MAKRRADGEGSIYKRQDGVWTGSLTIGYNERGGQKRKVVYGRTQKEAREKLDEARRQMVTGTLSTTRLTIAEYLQERWLKDKAKSRRTNTIRLYESLSTLHIIPRIGKVRLDRLKPLHVQDMVSDIAEKVGVPTANKARRMLYGALKQAMKWELVARNVCEAVEPLPEKRFEMVIWSPEQAMAFLTTAQGHRLFAAYFLAMATGLRRGEILGLRWSDLDGDTLHIRRTYTQQRGKPFYSTPKTASGERLVVVPADALAVLEAHRGRMAAEAAELEAKGGTWIIPDLMFPNAEGKETPPVSFNHAWVKLQQAAKVPHARLHDLRHLHVSLLVRQGFDPRTIADRVGHADASFTLRRYSHMFEKQRKAAAVDLGQLLGTDSR